MCPARTRRPASGSSSAATPVASPTAVNNDRPPTCDGSPPVSAAATTEPLGRLLLPIVGVFSSTQVWRHQSHSAISQPTRPKRLSARAHSRGRGGGPAPLPRVSPRWLKPPRGAELREAPRVTGGSPSQNDLPTAAPPSVKSVTKIKFLPDICHLQLEHSGSIHKCWKYWVWFPGKGQVNLERWV